MVTSFCGWYSIANLTWNYLHEIGISKGTEISRYIDLQVVDYKQMDGINFNISEDTIIEDYSEILDKLEYHPFKGEDRDIEHYQFLKNVVIQH